MNIQDKIISIAKSYIGQQEIIPNAGFKDKTFEAKMIAAGWYKGAAWCEFMAKSTWLEAYAGTQWEKLINTLLNGSALSSYYACSHDGRIKVSQQPVPGAIAIFKLGTDPAKHEGHAGIVIDTSQIDSDIFVDVEGNTNDGSNPNIRDGFIVATKQRFLGLKPEPKILNLIGFILPPPTTEIIMS